MFLKKSDQSLQGSKFYISRILSFLKLKFNFVICSTPDMHEYAHTHTHTHTHTQSFNCFPGLLEFLKKQTKTIIAKSKDFSIAYKTLHDLNVAAAFSPISPYAPPRLLICSYKDWNANPWPLHSSSSLSLVNSKLHFKSHLRLPNRNIPWN